MRSASTGAQMSPTEACSRPLTDHRSKLVTREAEMRGKAGSCHSQHPRRLGWGHKHLLLGPQSFSIPAHLPLSPGLSICHQQECLSPSYHTKAFCDCQGTAPRNVSFQSCPLALPNPVVQGARGGRKVESPRPWHVEGPEHIIKFNTRYKPCKQQSSSFGARSRRGHTRGLTPKPWGLPGL